MFSSETHRFQHHPQISTASVVHPRWSRHEAQPHVLADKVLHIAALIVVVEFQKDTAGHTIRQLGEIVEGTKNPGAVEIRF